jgi:hypothetical protein
MDKLLTSERWLSHPWCATRMVEQIPIQYLQMMQNQNLSDSTDIMDGSIVPLDDLWADIEKNGMADPLLIRICSQTRMVRLESGNHRVLMASLNGYTHLPAATFLVGEHGDIVYAKANGTHRFTAEWINWEYVPKLHYDAQIRLLPQILPR